MASQNTILDVQNVSKRFGARELFANLSFSIAEGQKVGLIARNGTGKSTLLSILTGRESQDEGAIVYRNGIRTGYLEQEPVFNPDDTVLDACFNHQGDDEKIVKAKQILTRLKSQTSLSRWGNSVADSVSGWRLPMRSLPSPIF